ncbi:hypothetical protein [Candidatus Pantoea floridensis]|uniref:Uncharacterized protein n=1 Tax=Candidatus Pantoea floridensis TaxID=1938870 RepID=A0A286DRX6_9GAMM|nr:hypothetical protein [Pantoea floridensis]PIF06884.1 hypothetical protein BX596_5184 [Enterobacteriaceae bacterium JKS000233]SOD61437.1 hypothetical protein SAMN06273570_5134 [Pantoea floridensis]
MAAEDPIVYAQLCKLFPALTPKQALNLCYYSLGSNYEGVSSLTDSTPAASKKSLESIQKYFDVRSLTDLKSEFWARFFTHQINKKYSWTDAHSLKVLGADNVSSLLPLFPELTRDLLINTIFHYFGYSMNDIALSRGISATHAEISVHEAMSALGAGSDQLLRTVISSRFMGDLC